MKTEIINKATHKLKHRGPDDSNIYNLQHCALGHTRLSIIDINNGTQPMQSACGRYTIVFNGEIYNYKSLRVDLRSINVKCITNSDTEVLLLGLIHFGNNWLKKLNGIFSFALWDSFHKRLLIARDSFGVKPLYFSLPKNGVFVFASEPKAIFATDLVKKKVNNSVLFEYLSRQEVSPPNTLFANIFEVRPGEFCCFSKLEGLVKKQFFLVEELVEDTSKNLEIDDLSNLLSKVVDQQMVADVPVGIALSGGIDSGLLLHNMNSRSVYEEISAYTYTSEQNNEVNNAQEAVRAFNGAISHKLVNHDNGSPLTSLVQLSKKLDFPISYPSIEPMHALANSASSDGVKILLAGQGADEIFLGYTRYLDLIKFDSVAYEEWKNLIFFGGGIDNVSLLEQLTFKRRSIIEDSNSWKYLESIKFAPKHVQLSIFDLRERILQLLRRDDMAGMLAGVEIRVPFLDVEIVSFGLNLPLSKKIFGNQQKVILRNLAETKLSSHHLKSPKMGSLTNYESWLYSNDFCEQIKFLINKDTSLSSNYFNLDCLNQMISIHRSHKKYGYLLWAILNLEIWNEQVLQC